jgi:hypothetical protein
MTHVFIRNPVTSTVLSCLIPSLGGPVRRRSRAGGEPVKPRRRKTATLKRGIGPKAVCSSSDATPGTEVARLTRELQDALQQQTATAEVLRVISRTPFNLQSVLDTLVQLAARLCDAEIVNIWRPKDGAYRLAANHPECRFSRSVGSAASARRGDRRPTRSSPPHPRRFPTEYC